VVLNSYMEAYLPESILTRTSQYRDIENVQYYRTNVNESKVWYAVWYTKVLSYVVFGLLIYVYYAIKKAKVENATILRIYSFILLFLSVTNIVGTFPSGGRFYYIGNCVAMSFFVYLVSYNLIPTLKEHSFRWVLPFLIFFILISFRNSLYSLSISTIFGNPLIALYTINENVSLNDIIK